ncbi:PREDICTED: uncharacterized protein LOC104609435 [Nelumbo nucifera]|uniref:Ninja-family protein n=1 Tax=Nelumbo nucifera TaxID=4432 RepID=A0A1U8B403_NELNU|nr:PREDICTED: uncharacterized protein LOC104609435 [Nelumbo nucifera]
MVSSCGMVEVEENEVELTLGLSIGGCFRRSEEKVTSPCLFEVKYGEAEGSIREKERSLSGSGLSSTVDGGGGEGEGKVRSCGGDDILYPQKRREIHALRRQEARKKREEKQQKKGICKGRRGSCVNGNVPMRIGSLDVKMWVEGQEIQSRVRDREGMENAGTGFDRACKKYKFESTGSDNQQAEEQTLKQNQNHNQNPSAFAAPPFPVVPMQYPFPHLQYVPFTNGFTFPYVMPCWAPPIAAVGNDKNVIQPVACRVFHPFQVPTNQNANKQPPICDSEHDGSKSGVANGTHSSLYSSGSAGSSSSAVSDYQSTSLQGGNSSGTRSHSSHSLSEKPRAQVTVVGKQQGQSEQRVSSPPVGLIQAVDQPTHHITKVVSSNAAPSSPKKPEEEPISGKEPLPTNKPISTAANPPPPHPLKEARVDVKRPPKLPQPPQASPMPHMPYVSTTGNGPNGKTITGFLYRYTKTEVSIICVCHGTSFSPVEFVKHAGGMDVSHPLRHIIVVPPSI